MISKGALSNNAHTLYGRISFSHLIAVIEITILFFLNLGKNAANLALEELFKLLLSILIEVMFIAEFLGKTDSSVTLEDDNSHALFLSEVHINEKKGSFLLFFSLFGIWVRRMLSDIVFLFLVLV